jgi:tRNA pseudouridine55 synthase
VIDKPAGWTSHDVVAKVRRLLGQRQVGHGGTLDPAATGVLPVAVGAATRVLEFVSDASKSYLAEVTFGVDTDTLDIEGRVSRTSDTSALTQCDVESALVQFRGPLDQVPPMHAAIKVDGRRLYELARQGTVIERQPRRITIFDLRLVDWQPPTATLFVDCSKGTYIRSLAHELGEVVGAGAYLSNLVRLRTGPFTLSDAWTLTELAQRDLVAEWPSVALHPDVALDRAAALLLDTHAARDWESGREVPGDGDGAVASAYDQAGAWLGVGRFDVETQSWRPLKVVPRAA